MESSSPPPDDYYQWLLAFNELTFYAPTGGVWFAIFITLLLIACSALVSGSEVAYFSLSKEIDKLRSESGKAPARVLGLLSRPRYLLATILIANNLINVAIVIISYYIFSNTLDFSAHPLLGFLVNVVGVTFFLVLFGEVMPKVYATRYNVQVAMLMSYPLTFLRGLFKPLSFLLVSSTSIIERRLKRSPNGNVSLEELEHAIDLTTGHRNDKEEMSMLKGIVKFGNITVKQIMQPRVDVVAVDKEDSFKELLDTVREAGYSRIPVYKETLDHVEGVLYAKDLLSYLDEGESFHWQQLLRPAFFVPETKKIDDLLKEIQQNRVHLAVVVDEYGGTSGIITLEDILEEIIGDIKDEYDTMAEINYKKLDSHNYIFEGKTLLNDICKVMGLRGDTFDEVKGEADSLAGLLLEIGGKIPSKQETIEYGQFVFTVMSLGKNRIGLVKVTILEEAEVEDEVFETD